MRRLTGRSKVFVCTAQAHVIEKAHLAGPGRAWLSGGAAGMDADAERWFRTYGTPDCGRLTFRTAPAPSRSDPVASPLPGGRGLADAGARRIDPPFAYAGDVPDLHLPVTAPLTVGFDLDLTLADTREGIAATYRALAAETGVFIDVPTVIARLGPPLERELAHWFPPAQIPAAAARYRQLYGDIAVPVSTPMPGALQAVQAVREHSGRAIVVTAKSQRHAEATVAALGLPVDAVIGGLFGTEKGEALREHGAGVYVGDHLADVDAARAAGARSVAVATGPFDAAALRAHGADVVLEDLAAFPAWLAGTVPAAR